MTAFCDRLLESAAELAASLAPPSDPNMHRAAAMSADRRVVLGHDGGGLVTTITTITITISRDSHADQNS
jgi:hypothetical protein